MEKLSTSRGLLKFIFFSLITFYIYGIVILTKITNEVNKVASPHDHRHSMHFCLLFFLIGPITLGIGTLVWWNNICGRIGNELYRRGSSVSLSAGTYWGWCILGSLLFGIGPFIFYYKFFKASNALNDSYNKEIAAADTSSPQE